jgi:hypothetical protein
MPTRKAAPKPSELQRLVEVPFRDLVSVRGQAEAETLDIHSGYVAGLAVQPTPLSLGFELWTSPGGWHRASDELGVFCPALPIPADMTQTTTSITLADASTLNGIEIGSAAMIGNEIVRVDAINTTTGAVTLGRGCADTIPTSHAAGEIIWFYDGFGTADETEYVQNTSVSARLLTATSSGTLALSGAGNVSTTVAARAGRPYPPGNFRINGQAYPETITGELTVSWAHRDRLTQSDLLVDTSQGDIGPEPGTAYRLKLYKNGILSHTEITSANSFTWSDEDGYMVGDAVLLHFDGDFTDVSGKTWTQDNGVTIDSAVSRFGSGSAKFTAASSQRLKSENLQALALGTRDFTIELWCNLAATQPSASNKILLNINQNGSSSAWTGGAVQFSAVNGSISGPAFFVYNYGESPLLAGNTNLRGAGWSHVAVVRNGSRFMLFINGILEAEAQWSGVVTASSGVVYIGGSTTSANTISGNIDEVRITTGIARYTQNFTPPSAPFTFQPPVFDGTIRATLDSIRDDVPSLQEYDWTVTRG